MDYQEFAPTPQLAPVVERLWTLDGHAADLTPGVQPVLPDGRPELIIHFGDRFERLHADGGVERQPSLIFAGQLLGQLALRPTGRVAVLGIRFHPYGAVSLLNIPQGDLAGLTVDVADISAGLAQRLAELRDEGVSLREAAVRVQEILAAWIDPGGIDARVQYAVEAIGRTQGRLSMSGLAGRVGLTCRHLERQFLRTVGVSPKRLARITRFQHALALLDRLDSSRRGTLTAVTCGYSDQAHFIRDFRDLAGCPPGEHLLRQTELTGFFIRERTERTERTKK
jgi:AraC-like DNA-binding protein